MWGRAQREATRRCSSDWGHNLGEGWVNSTRSNVTCPELSYISLHSTRSVDHQWVKLCAYNFYYWTGKGKG